jgi:hypothetical protein
MAYLTPLSKLEKMSQDAAFRREGEEEMHEKETSSNTTPSSVLGNNSLVVTISEDAQNQMVRVILPLSFPHQAHPHLKFNPPPKTRLSSQPQEESAASFNTSKKVVVNGVEIPRIKTHLISNMTSQPQKVSSQSNMSTSQSTIVSSDVNANNNAQSHQSPHRLKSCDHIEDDAETSSNLASPQVTGSWKAIKDMEATQPDNASFQSHMSPSQGERNKSETYNNSSLFSQRANNSLKVHDVIANTERNNSNLSMSTSQVATNSGDPIERAPIRPYNVVPQSCFFAPQNNNGSSSVVFSKEQRKIVSQSNINIPAASGNANFDLPMSTPQITKDNSSRLELRQNSQSQNVAHQTLKQNNSHRASYDVNVNNSAPPQGRVGTLTGRVNSTMPVRVSACSKKCKILGLCIFNIFAVAIPTLIGEYCSEDSAKKDFNAVLGGMIGLGVAFAVDIYMVWSRRLS